MYSNIVIICLL